MRTWLPTSGGQLLNYKTFRMKVIKCNPGFPQHVTRYKQLDYLEHPVCLWQKANPNKWSQFWWNTCDLWLGQKLGWDQKIQDVRIKIWRIHREVAVHMCAMLSTLHVSGAAQWRRNHETTPTEYCHCLWSLVLFDILKHNNNKSVHQVTSS